MTEPTDGVFMSCVEIADQLQHEPSLAECSPEFADAIASHLYRYVRQLYLFSLWRFSLQKTGFVFSWFYHCFGISYGFQKLHKTLCLVKTAQFIKLPAAATQRWRMKPKILAIFVHFLRNTLTKSVDFCQTSIKIRCFSGCNLQFSFCNDLESFTLETDVYVWRYTFLVVHARKEEEK